MKYYTTRSDDTIYRLAVLFYYRWDLWPLLYYPNEGALGIDPFTIASGIRIMVPEPLLTDELHGAVEGDTTYTLAESYYGLWWFYRLIEEANAWPILLKAGEIYRIPALCSQMEYDAAAEMRKALHVELD
ncbi:MAG: hypothetical protein EPN93_17505 [Spirochaetes bacterium]|nr:MAG: hypothetical protein EPN93_17505 [Spirochaetota bacterium]